MKTLPQTPLPSVPDGKEIATLAAGCFWCIEAVFQNLRGIEGIMPGYSGGFVMDPSYQEITTGTTGHAEAIQFFYDPSLISYQDLLEVFWGTHDPTTLNQQGADVGPQYRSAIFYHSAAQQKTAEEFKQLIDKAGVYEKPIVTEITAFTNFYPAENYHLNYYENHANQPYCQIMIKPKLEKLKKVFGQHTKLI
ncbi:peptide-methionine (S)-S-oxide reductase [Echinicola strongylocentroti]|uniref:Peptide methionine sulfoxide reductase MsrA n=1 Tax=Echinicola strongylocentroti TaxID=1795355 RepID=A0A2Z4IQA1_9BACT|nr:peptide-methionine (S)-S-oxide reductase MsrA [Echinicola strongylocentroti]AWW32974.1 peptide-methionine (S)-S-oxide reductase [Echinicola strongylocentroti]